MVSNRSIHLHMAWERLTQSCKPFYRQHHHVIHGYTHVDLSISSRGHTPLENTRATPCSVCHHHRHGIHLHDVLTHGYTHVVSIIITISIILQQYGIKIYHYNIHEPHLAILMIHLQHHVSSALGLSCPMTRIITSSKPHSHYSLSSHSITP